MSEKNPPDDPPPPSPAGGEEPYCEEIQHAQVSALVPERVARGVFSTGTVIVHGPNEFILDFLLRMSQPHQVVARVVLPPVVVAQFAAALAENLRIYESKHGHPFVPNTPAGWGPGSGAAGEPISAQDLYEQLKMSDEVLSGCYANAVMIGHTPNEFCFDFITTFFPRSAVSCRVFLAAPGVPRLLESLKHSLEKHRQKLNEQRGAPPPTPPDPSVGH